MVNMFVNFFETSITTSIIILSLLLLIPSINKLYVAKWKYWTWIILAFRLILAINIPFSQVFLQIPIPDAKIVLPQNPQLLQYVKIQDYNSSLEQNIQKITVIEIITFVWLTGFLIILIHQFVRYYIFQKLVLRWSFSLENDHINEQLKRISRDLHIRKQIKWLFTEKAVSPMMIGFFNPILLLPNEVYTDSELYFILKHELIHFKRHDLWYKILLLIASALHWFNPVIFLMLQEANKDIELSCDDEVIKDMSIDKRKQYSETILSSIRKQCKFQITLTTYFYGGYKIIKERFQNILSMKVKRRGLIAYFFLIIIILFMEGIVACSTKKENNNATDVVTMYLEAKKNNDFEAWKSTLWSLDDKQNPTFLYEKEGDLGVVSLTIDKVIVSDDKTKSIIERYTGSDLAVKNEWTNDYISGNMVAVYAQYNVDYDNTKVPYNEGAIAQYFYLIRADKDSPWLIWDQSYDVNN